jgi:hypothetical protein
MKNLEKKLEDLYKNPTQEQFDVLANNVLALSLIYSSSSEELRDYVRNCKKSFDGWLNVYQHSKGELQELALQKMSEFDEDFEEWWTKYFAHPKKRLKELALQNIIGQLKLSFKGWENLYYCSKGELRELALQKMSERAQTFDEWETIYHYSKGKLRK